MERKKNLIQQVRVINEKHETIKSINGENFNIFSILKIERKEVNTHSYFIYDLLNPKGSHNQEDKFLRIFLKQIFLKQILEKEDYENIGSTIEAKVEREKIIEGNRRIDFTIETSNFFIAIEMKIDARDQDNQLYDYYQYLERQNKEKSNKLFYLTLDGKEADEKSTNNLEVNKDYFLISFQYDIYNWIEACIEKVATIPTIREGLVHYRNLIRKLTNQMGDEMDKDIIKIIETPEDIKAMYIIYSEYANILAKKEVEFWESLEENLEKQLKDDGFKVKFLTDSKKGISEYKKDYKKIAEQRKSKNDYFGLNLSLNRNKVLFDIDLYSYNDEDFLTMQIEIYKKNKNIDLSILDEQLKEIGFIKKHKNSRWFYLKEKIKFYGSGEPTFELFDDNKFKELVESTSKEVIKTLNKLKEDILLQDI